MDFSIISLLSICMRFFEIYNQMSSIEECVGNSWVVNKWFRICKLSMLNTGYLKPVQSLYCDARCADRNQTSVECEAKYTEAQVPNLVSSLLQLDGVHSTILCTFNNYNYNKLQLLCSACAPQSCFVLLMLSAICTLHISHIYYDTVKPLPQTIQAERAGIQSRSICFFVILNHAALHCIW